MARQTIAITGAESGIGAACAQRFGGAGSAVAILYHDDERAADAVRTTVEQAGGSAAIYKCDVRDEASVESAFGRIERDLGLAAVLVNSAGLNERGVRVADMDLAKWEQLIATDLTGVFLTSRRFVRALHDAGSGGAIVNISSIHAKAVRIGAADYCAAKAGVKRLTETMAIEEAANGIRVNAVAPGMILTPMNARAVADAGYRDRLAQSIPIGRPGTAEEVAGLVQWLASDAAAYVTGASFVIDGGLSLVLGQGA